MKIFLWLTLTGILLVSSCSKSDPASETPVTVAPPVTQPTEKPDYMKQYVGTYDMQDSVKIINYPSGKITNIYKHHIVTIQLDSVAKKVYCIYNFWDQGKVAPIIMIDSVSFYIEGALPWYKNTLTGVESPVSIGRMKFKKVDGKLIIAPFVTQTTEIGHGFSDKVSAYFKLEKAW